jgi:hypothetical protein
MEDRFFSLAKTLGNALRGIRHFEVTPTASVTYQVAITGDRLAEAKKALADLQDVVCMCGHQGPDRKGEHVGAEIPAPSKRLACTHPGCNCKGFGNLQASVNFIMDERLGGP